MTHELLLEAGVNYIDGIKRFGGKTALYEKYLMKFPQDTNRIKLIYSWRIHPNCLGAGH